MILIRCANAKDPDCTGHETGGFVDERDMLLLTRDGVAVTICCTCYIKVSDIVGEAEQVLKPRPVLHPAMSNEEIIRRLVGEE